VKLDDTLLSLSFQRSPSEHNIYVRQNGDAHLLVGVYVNDLVITGSNCDNIKSFKEEMATAFKMSDLGLLHYYLSIEVKQCTSGILLSQGAYAMKLPREVLLGEMQSLSNAHGGTLEAEQVKHATASGCYNISEHHRESEVFGEYSSQPCICYWIRELLSGGAAGGSPCSGDADSPLCGRYQQLGTLVWSEEGKSSVVDMVQ
jgi:hypothetical protein